MANNGKKGIVENAILEGGVEGLVMTLLHSLGKTVTTTIQEHAGEYLKSNILNIGTNDEELYLLARAYALEKGWVTLAELQKISEVIDEYSPSQRKRIIGMLGKREDDGTSREQKLRADGTKVLDKEKNPVYVETTFKTNIAGAKIIALLAKMDKAQIKKELDSSNASNSLEHNIAETIKTAATKVENSELAKDSNNFFAKKTWLEKFAESRRPKQI
jgi:hypothetical protein